MKFSIVQSIILLLPLSILISIVSAQQGNDTANLDDLPKFFANDCLEFRTLLNEHTHLSEYDRRHATNLGIAAVVLFWTGVPAIPFGIASIWLGIRAHTDSRDNLVEIGITKQNWQRVNHLCAKLLRLDRLDRVTFNGRITAAIILGSVAIALSLLTFLVQGCYGVLMFCFREPKTVFRDREGDDASAEQHPQDQHPQDQHHA